MKLSRYKRNSSTSYALGATLTYELFKTKPELIQRVFLRPEIKKGEDLTNLIAKLRDSNIEIIESQKPFNVLDAKEDCLLIAEFTKTSQQLDQNAPHIVLVNPSDAGNLGTIMRSAAAFGFKNLAIITPAVDFCAPKTIRASMGAAFHLNIQEFSSIEEYRQQNTERPLYAFMLNSAAQHLAEAAQSAPNRYSLVFGNEASGLPANFADFCQPVFIPQSSEVDSLNLSVATSIALYTFRQI